MVLMRVHSLSSSTGLDDSITRIVEQGLISRTHIEVALETTSIMSNTLGSTIIDRKGKRPSENGVDMWETAGERRARKMAESNR